MPAGRAFHLGARGLGLLVAGLLAAAPIAAQDEIELPRETERIAVEAMSRLRSPYTASHTVDMCPSASALRDSIRVAAASGQSSEQIVEDVVARHGEQLRLLPKRSGVGLWAWLLPPLVLLGGGALIVRRLRGARPDPRLAAPSPSLSAGERDELAAALREWEKRSEVEA